jgi:hypothetical protein
MAIRHYDHTHDTVPEVKACPGKTNHYQDHADKGTITQTQANRYMRNEAATRPAWTPTMANEGQNKYVQGLSEKRDYRFSWDKSVDVAHFLSVEVSHLLWNFLKGKPLTSKEASLVIDDLKAAPRRANVPVSPAPAGAGTAEGSPAVAGYTAKMKALRADVPDGRYAVNVPEYGQDKLQFFRVSTNDKGYTRITQYVSEARNPVQWSQYVKVLGAIKDEDPEKARITFAAELGRCWRCGLQLTDTHNPYKPFGLGPDCGPKVMG